MERRSFLKMLLASPLLGLLKKKEELKLDEYSFTADDIRAAMKDIPNFETTDTSSEEVLLGRTTFDEGGFLTVPEGENWEITRLRVDGRIGYVYGYINASHS